LTGFTGFSRILFYNFQIPPARLGKTQAAGRKLETYSPLSAEKNHLNNSPTLAFDSHPRYFNSEHLVENKNNIRRRRQGFQAFFRKAWKKRSKNSCKSCPKKPLLKIRIHSEIYLLP
jgi:hypothetical protein